MSYLVLARKWRPHNFEEMVGQSHVVRTLQNALDTQRLHHAYLFTGTRGVGKTTVARILAKCFNCEAGITSKPCGTCHACQEIDNGSFPDLIEVDAASNTKVEDTRELLNNAQYTPACGRYKIYLIDEVHMLSGHSFNALLKTLEEPPPHVKFLLATTDPQKLPVTVLSRCLQFHLKNMSSQEISEQLERILEAENVSHEKAALPEIARAANGSMRDALSLLDQIISYSGSDIKSADVHALLGTVDQQTLYTLFGSLIEKDGNAIATQIRELAMQNCDFAKALEDLLSILHRIALIQAVPETLGSMDTDKKTLQQLAESLSVEDTQLYYQIGLIGRRDLPLAPSAHTGFEMVMLRMLAFTPQTTASTATSIPSPTTIKTTTATTTPSIPTPKTKTETPPETSTPLETSTPTEIGNWANILPHLNLSGITATVASHCCLKEMSDSHIHLLLEPSASAMLSPTQEKLINEALNNYFKRPYQLTISIEESTTSTPANIKQQKKQAQLTEAEKNIISDPIAQSIMEKFGATIKSESIKITE